MQKIVTKFTPEHHFHSIKIQKSIRGFLCRKGLKEKKDNMTFEIVCKLLENFKNQSKDINELNKILSKKKIRQPNFPSEISENIVKFAFFQKYKIMPSWDTKSGDLECINILMEVKAFSSNGPTTFGPTEKWDRIYFVDATRFQESEFVIYEFKLKSTNTLWENLKMNKTQTYKDQCKEKRRPRINFSDLFNQLKDECTILFKGNLKGLDIKN